MIRDKVNKGLVCCDDVSASILQLELQSTPTFQQPFNLP